ncbi:hypothetical protein FH972_024941 [Carpinus fangiana]|uniref:Phospholipase n=1 Tax=Carpinus fangiana TaxID=176857 RepID=A0A5N6KZX2_9ROSI|nr:hypothetical protein FH972_024941 [Carpinus fangiana]
MSAAATAGLLPTQDPLSDSEAANGFPKGSKHDSLERSEDAVDVDRPEAAPADKPGVAPLNVNTSLPKINGNGSISHELSRANGATKSTVDEVDAVPRRPSVQFSTPDTPTASPRETSQSPRPTSGHQRHSSNILSRIRALAPTNTSLKPKSPAANDDEAQSEWVDDTDADAETSGAEEGASTAAKGRQKRKRRRFFADDSPSSPFTHASRTASFAREETEATIPEENDSRAITRRVTSMSDMAHDRQGVSEDEGRARMSKLPAWRRRSSNWFAQSLSNTADARTTSGAEPSTPGKAQRPSNLKRLSQLAAGSYSGDASPSPWQLRTDPAQRRWRQIKAGLKMLGPKRKAEPRIDYVKSAELVAELLAGSPAAVIMASHFQRDEHERRKVPILLEQLRVNVTDIDKKEDNPDDRHVRFKIDCEYFSGRMHMTWSVWRSLGDFIRLHGSFKKEMLASNLKTWGSDDKRSKMPHFPKGTFPYFQKSKELEDEEDDEPAGAAEGPAPPEPIQALEGRPQDDTPTQSPSRSRPRPFRFHTRRASSNLAALVDKRMDPRSQRQRKKIEAYLREMIRFQMFRPGSNRICKFLELSTISVLMSIDGSYKGKEGVLSIQRTTGMDSRRKKAAAAFTKAKPMWFLVRESYIFCVDSVDESIIYDVFLVDTDFTIRTKRPRLRDQKGAREMAKTATSSAANPSGHVLRLENSERKVKLLARNEAQLNQFEESIRQMSSNTEWSQRKRFDSFAPVRRNVFAMWLVDARDYFWNVSRGISMAKHVIYIHDWWLSPELYLRRPPAVSYKWRLDRLLHQKASEGVKIYVMVYRNIDTAIPIDSQHTKSVLLDLHPNIFVQRSPNQIRQKSFFWAHHEKLCVVDYNLAFCGGVDLCFGRFDAPSHVLTDDKMTGMEPSVFPRDTDHCQTWPGKDYSNPRVQDFFELTAPYAEMYDRSKVPRMPWHDIGMQVTGQPARDLSRHFVQRWNFILRQRTPSRPTPFLIPPPDFTEAQLDQYGLRGTCDVQMLRSCAQWSIGLKDGPEHSIMNAYIRLIDRSEHFVYIENQFFITSTMVDNTKIHNGIGDALVERIIRAHKNKEQWKAVIVIPLMPGFQSTVDSQDGTSIRLIMQCQYRSICRGKHSIFARLHDAGIKGQDYIQFYSLRKWGKIGRTKALVTEQLYIHAKCMVVDDRFAIIGSANINERSMLGTRDSEIASVIRDTDYIDSYMAGKPYKVGRFPHTLRMRLMREHLGIDVDDAVIKEEQFADFGYEQGEPATDDEMLHEEAKRKVEKGPVHKDAMRDPLDDGFIKLWQRIATKNTDIYRQVFRCMPDDNVRTWRDYEEYMSYSDRFAQAQGLSKSSMRMQQEAKGASGPPGVGSAKLPGTSTSRDNYADDKSSEHSELKVIDREVAESLLEETTGHLVRWPYYWLDEEERGGKWLFSLDQMSPLEIYD